jgi:hypothetical protein
MPLFLGMAWWKFWMEATWPQGPVAHHEHRHPADDQLVVPEPIEVKGEHALFA